MNVLTDPGTSRRLVQQFIASKACLPRLLAVLERLDILEALPRGRVFTAADVLERLQKRGMRAADPVQRTVIGSVVDLLEEIGWLVRLPESDSKDQGNGEPRFVLQPGNGNSAARWTPEEHRGLHQAFRGQMAFFEEALESLEGLLWRGARRFQFSLQDQERWDQFLGNPEYQLGRWVTLRAMHLRDAPDVRLLDLCYGLGHSLAQIQDLYPRIRVAALDFTDVFRGCAMAKLRPEVRERIQWVNSHRWRAEGRCGFGVPLPFDDASFDGVLFACCDAYVADAEREHLYREIRRVLKPSGVLGVLTWGYPDAARQWIRNHAVRVHVYTHNIAGAVCENWSGFKPVAEMLRLFRRLGFRPHWTLQGAPFLLDGAVWVLQSTRHRASDGCHQEMPG